jgi:hypothetical protein
MQTMSFNTMPTAGLSKRAAVRLAAFGIGLGVILALLDPPLWVCYLAPISMAPILVPELRRHGAQGTRHREGDRR